MSTRAAIARAVDKGDGGIHFEGRYHHWDGYPTGLGATLYEAYNGFFQRDLDAMLKYLVDDHPAGWSTINGSDFSLEPGFFDSFDHNGTCVCGLPENEHLCQTSGHEEHVRAHLPYPCGRDYGLHLGHRYEPDEATRQHLAAIARIPRCFCHGGRSENAYLVTEENASGSGCEYVYVLKDTPDGAVMLILSSYTSIGSPTGEKDRKMIGFFGMGDENAEWKPIGVVGLDTTEIPDFQKIEEAA